MQFKYLDPFFFSKLFNANMPWVQQETKYVTSPYVHIFLQKHWILKFSRILEHLKSILFDLMGAFLFTATFPANVATAMFRSRYMYRELNFFLGRRVYGILSRRFHVKEI